MRKKLLFSSAGVIINNLIIISSVMNIEINKYGANVVGSPSLSLISSIWHWFRISWTSN